MGRMGCPAGCAGPGGSVMVDARLVLGLGLSLGVASCGEKPAGPSPGLAPAGPAAAAPMQPAPAVDRSQRPAPEPGRGEPVAC